MKKTALNAALALAMGVSAGGSYAANSLYTFAGTMNFYDAGGVLGFTDTTVSGTFSLTGGLTGGDSIFGSFVTSTPFFGYTWTADVDMLYSGQAGLGPQTYNWTNKTFTDIAGGTYQQVTCKTGATIDGCASVDPTYTQTAAVAKSYTFSFTNAGQFAAGTFFDWSVNPDIAVLAVFQASPPDANGNFTAVSVDSDGDGTPGTAMNNGPFNGQTPAFNGTMTCQDCGPAVVPVPAAVWLFGSGLIGLVGVARRKKLT